MIEDTGKLSVLNTLSITAAKVTYSPTSWRLARRNGELILQAGSIWVQGSEGGVEWSDVPTVNLNTP